MADTARDEHTLFLGKECKHPACHLHDFLPFSVSLPRSVVLCTHPR
jgi:hypothetical protein